MITKLEWDSDFFGYTVGKVDLTKILKFSLKDFLNEAANYKLVYIFSPLILDINKAIHADRKALFSKPLVKTGIHFQELNYCEKYIAGIHDYEQLESLAIESGKYSRFKVDPNFVNNEFSRLYKKWIENSVLKISAIETLIMLDHHEIVGLITIGRKSDKTAEISLVAVAPGHQSKGIGSKLIRDAETYALNEGFHTLQVVTQQLNVNAMKLYQKNDFIVERITNIYHFWNL